MQILTGSMHLETMRTGLRIVSHILMISEKWSVDPPSAGDARESPIITRWIDIVLGCVIEIVIDFKGRFRMRSEHFCGPIPLHAGDYDALERSSSSHCCIASLRR